MAGREFLLFFTFFFVYLLSTAENKYTTIDGNKRVQNYKELFLSRSFYCVLIYGVDNRNGGRYINCDFFNPIIAKRKIQT